MVNHESLWDTIRGRVRLAWQVLTGTADVLPINILETYQMQMDECEQLLYRNQEFERMLRAHIDRAVFAVFTEALCKRLGYSSTQLEILDRLCKEYEIISIRDLIKLDREKVLDFFGSAPTTVLFIETVLVMHELRLGMEVPE